MAENNVMTMEDLTKFDAEGYSFQPSDSVDLPYDFQDANGTSPELVFDRPASSAPPAKKQKKK